MSSKTADHSLTSANPGWPDASFGDHPVTELVALVAGGLSPFGQETFPLPKSEVLYVHPYTVRNR